MHSFQLNRRDIFLQQTDVGSINKSQTSFVATNESTNNKLRHSVSFTSPKTVYQRFDEPGQLRKEQSTHRYHRAISQQIVLDASSFIEIYDLDETDLDARTTVLRKCGQADPLCFSDVYSPSALRQCRKIGEGVYGEVFMNKTVSGQAVVLKVIPIEGQVEFNGERQKCFNEILNEILISMELSSLRNGDEYRTSGFVEVLKVRCVQGCYPEQLVELWELYRDNHGSDNDHPEIFPDDQLFIVLELANAGQDLESFNLNNALQSLSAYQQTVLTLAVAEKKFRFEHRDLHWGNLLLAPTDDPEIIFKLNGREYVIPTQGVKVTIIDFTLSRMEYDNRVLFANLAEDYDLFAATGDYQYDIYRLMKDRVENNWIDYEPFTNVLWLHYVIDKMISGARYRNTKSKKHRGAIQTMMTIRDQLLDNTSAFDALVTI